MGGASKSNFDAVTGQWRGQVTDANNGGFIGIRSTPFVEWDMSNCQGIEIITSRSSSGGGVNNLRLKLVVRDSTEFNGIGWTTSVDNKKGSNTLRALFSKQIPTRFAKRLSGSETFSKDQVKGVQLVYSKFEYDGDLNPSFSVGDFQLQVLEIRAF